MNRPNLIFCAVALVAVVVGCGRKSEPANAESLPAVAVRLERVTAKPRVATEEVVGTVRAKLRAVIEAKISGRIQRMLVVPGQNVDTSELLIELDVREVQARVDQARAVRQQAEADLKRFTALHEQNILSQAEFDNAQSRYRIADAAALESETLLGYAKVTAPFAGVITRKLADVGDLAAPGKPLLEMEDARTLRLEADVPEAVVDQVKLGDRLQVRIVALGTNLQGVVSEISPAADPGSRTFLVKLDLPAITGFRAGQFGRVAMPVGETSALRVPDSAIVQRGQMEFVFVAINSHAQLRIVKTGKRVGHEIEIISGLSSGEQVVTESPAGLTDGQPIQ